MIEPDWVPVKPKLDEPLFAVRVTLRNMEALAATLSASLTITETSAGPEPCLLFAEDRAYNLRREAIPGDWIIRHIRSSRMIEILADDAFRRQVEPIEDPKVVAPEPDLDYLVACEVGEGVPWAIIADQGIDGIAIKPGPGASGTLIVGMAQKIARGKS